MLSNMYLYVFILLSGVNLAATPSNKDSDACSRAAILQRLRNMQQELQALITLVEGNNSKADENIENPYVLVDQSPKAIKSPFKELTSPPNNAKIIKNPKEIKEVKSVKTINTNIDKLEQKNALPTDASQLPIPISNTSSSSAGSKPNKLVEKEVITPSATPVTSKETNKLTNSSSQARSLYTSIMTSIACRHYAKAKTQIKEFLGKFSTDKNIPAVHYWYGVVLKQDNNSKLALQQFTTALTLALKTSTFKIAGEAALEEAKILLLDVNNTKNIALATQLLNFIKGNKDIIKIIDEDKVISLLKEANNKGSKSVKKSN